MVKIDIFLTTLDLVVDDFCKTVLPPEPRPVPQTTFSQSEVMTWAMFGSSRALLVSAVFIAMRHAMSAWPFRSC